MIGPFGERLEIQIRTDEMHKVADAGVAAHWEYKDGKLSLKDSQKFHWLRELVEAQESLKDSSEFIESVKLDLFENDIYIFTPKGELREFPEGSSPLDFAYAVHTDVGNKCVGAKVNGRIVPLKHKLRSGDTVEIITSPTQKPSKDWVKLCKTGRAISKIRQYIRTEERERSKLIGYDVLDREFRRYGQSLAKLEKAKDRDEKAANASFAGFEEMLISVGYGKASPEKIVQKMFPDLRPVESEPEVKKSALSEMVSKASKDFAKTPGGNSVKVEGIDGVLIRYGRCCAPIPGDEITGFISRGRGVTVHKISCPRVLDLDPNRRIGVIWASEADRFLRDVRIKIVTRDEPGLLNDMSRVISKQGINIKSANLRVHSDNKATGTFDLQVKNKLQLGTCMKELEGLTGIISVEQVSMKKSN